MSSEPTELHPNTRSTIRALSAFHTESRAVVIAAVSLVVSCLAGLMAFIAVNDAKTSLATVNVELRSARDEVAELRGDIAVYRIRAAKLDAWLKAHEIPIEDIYQ